MQREEPVGARLRDPGTEGRPGAAGLNGVGPDVSLVTGKSAGRSCPNSGGTTEKEAWSKGLRGSLDRSEGGSRTARQSADQPETKGKRLSGQNLAERDSFSALKPDGFRAVFVGEKG